VKGNTEQGREEWKRHRKWQKY